MINRHHLRPMVNLEPWNVDFLPKSRPNYGNANRFPSHATLLHNTADPFGPGSFTVPNPLSIFTISRTRITGAR
jgi:hypothetical protein